MDTDIDVDCVDCHGVLVLLGILGDLAWFRCRDCGLDQSITSAQLEDLANGWQDDPDDPDHVRPGER
jgi:hypothetical protein